MFELKKYKTFALEQLKNRWKAPVLMTIIVLAISALFTIPERALAFNTADLQSLIYADTSEILDYFSKSTSSLTGGFLLSIIQSLVEFIFAIATLNLYLAMARSPEPVNLKLFVEGLNNWGRGILAGLWQTLWIILWMLIAIPATVVGVLVGVLLTSFETTPFIILGVLCTCIITFAGFLPVIIKSISYNFIFYAAAEFENISVTKALDISKTITKGHKKDVFVAMLSFIGWGILSIFTFGLLNLWLTPYYTMTMTNVYHALLKEAIEKGTIKQEDLQ